MNKKQIINISIAVVVLIIAYVIFQTYVYKDLFFGRLRGEKDEQGAEDANNQVSDNGDNVVGVGCGGSYTEIITIDYNNPQENMFGCGSEVLSLQRLLNTQYGQNLAEDGKYGANTRQAHQNVLDSMNGTWAGETPIYGCTISVACNYNPNATVLDNSCDFSSCYE